jgi:hypothetical protein
MSTQTLAPGSQARIYRDGGTLIALALVPDEGRFEVRGLLPGQYVARDELGGEQPFEVRVGEEVAVVAGQGANVAPGASGLPGTGGRVAFDALHVGGAPVFRTPGQVAPGVNVTSPIANVQSGDVEAVPKPHPRRVPRNDPAEDVRVPGQPGSSIVTEVPSNVGEREPGDLAPAEQSVVDADAEQRDRAEAA